MLPKTTQKAGQLTSKCSVFLIGVMALGLGGCATSANQPVSYGASPLQKSEVNYNQDLFNMCVDTIKDPKLSNFEKAACALTLKNRYGMEEFQQAAEALRMDPRVLFKTLEKIEQTGVDPNEALCNKPKQTSNSGVSTISCLPSHI